MLGQIHVSATRAVAGFLMIAHVVGMLFYGPRLSTLTLAYGVLIALTLGTFCFLPRHWLRRVRVPAVALACAALCATLVKIYGDITLINGADHGAIVLRALVVGILVIMIRDAISQSTKP